ncbi:hypothetical protein [Stutzerimonas stutzeri]|uniref:hypothetical protein n=1 Tax=Stutzerimonas stutzeri TaxID=316 RepID=UPI002446CBC7|nr:hypothetical protein [Stutzerimonas stutzeri]MDH0157369.1 hypothetical protein [Stutzerimonas stutzeri]
MSAEVGGVATYEHAADGKDDLETMLRCCDAEEASYWEQCEGERFCAAPYFFQRVAILQRKAKNYAGEISACERWKAIANDYRRQPMVKARQAVLVHKGPRSEAILARLPKAKELLRKQKAAAKGKG